MQLEGVQGSNSKGAKMLDTSNLAQNISVLHSGLRLPCNTVFDNQNNAVEKRKIIVSFETSLFQIKLLLLHL